jgi:hypothetical protein
MTKALSILALLVSGTHTAKAGSTSQSSTAPFQLRAVEPRPLLKSPLQSRQEGNLLSGSVRLRRIQAQSSAQFWLQSIRHGESGHGNFVTQPNTTELTFLNSQVHVGTIEIGSQDLQVIMDTGSSDTWVLHENFTCLVRL